MTLRKKFFTLHRSIWQQYKKKKKNVTNRVPLHEISPLYHNWAYIRLDNGCQSITCNNLITVLIGETSVYPYDTIYRYWKLVAKLCDDKQDRTERGNRAVFYTRFARTNLTSPFVCRKMRNNSIKSTIIEEQRVHSSFPSRVHANSRSFSHFLSSLFSAWKIMMRSRCSAAFVFWNKTHIHTHTYIYMYKRKRKDNEICGEINCTADGQDKV